MKAVYIESISKVVMAPETAEEALRFKVNEMAMEALINDESIDAQLPPYFRSKVSNLRDKKEKTHEIR